jgi:hypothetical protein
VPQNPADSCQAPPPVMQQGVQEPLLPPPTVQLKLSKPAPAIPLPDAVGPEPAVPVAEPQKNDTVLRDREPDGKTTAPAPSPPSKTPGDWIVNRNLWFDMIKWVHHHESIPPGQRKELLGNLVKTSRLVQQGRHLTNRQEETMRALLSHMKALGYRFP